MGENSGAFFIEAMLMDLRSNFSHQSGDGLATTTYKKALDDAIQVCTLD